ncbi:uncharacterized protein LOC126741197 isoform X2 [Anthonomus grandis grandis]|uniref:uncharacterized protein LOC126741197 isoform X2 n=1 Tax=Anthonomus grandis grandis TaxID=2921223 RepID=UPI002166910D|nr:uncharacterized protein LOC126741197 isoform X2 [Anthonomus grandis grandis]
MEELVGHIPLSLGAILLRTLVESYTGNPSQSSSIIGLTAELVPKAATAVLVSGAAVCGLYKQLRKGTLVNVGLGKKVSGMVKNARNLIQRRERNGDSWLLRNINGSRRNCMEALVKLSDQTEGRHQLSVPAQQSPIGQSNSSPAFGQPQFTNTRATQGSKEVPVENLYSNNFFGSTNYSSQEIRMANHSRAPSKRRKSVSRMPSFQRPITRNYRKVVKADEEPEIRPPSARKKRSDPTDDIKSKTSINQCESEGASKRSLHRLRDLSSTNRQQRRRGKIQKITRKTRSGKIYVYRI